MERLDQERVLGDPVRDKQDTLGHSFLLQQGVSAAPLDKLLESVRTWR